MKGPKICMNTSCRSTSSREWKTGWPMRSGGYARLCYSCGSAYENLVYCDTFHEEQSGWRECSTCNKRLHCGCVASKFLFELLDFGGVGCTSCSKNSELQLTQTGEISNGFSSLAKNKAGNLGSTFLENGITGSAVNEGKLAQLSSLMEAHEFNLISTFDGAESDEGLAKFIKEEVKHPIGDATACFSNPTPSSAGTSKFVKPDNTVSVLDVKDMNGPLARPSLRMNFGASLRSSSCVPYSCGVVEGMEQGKTFAFQQGQRSRPILPKPSKPSFALSSETNNAVVPKLRIARAPADGRGKNQLLPRYWPRITDQELQQLSGHLNSNIIPLFEKVLSASDAGRIGRLVLPKACAEAYFPPISQSEGLPLRVQDVKGREWTFQFRFWPNNNSRMYVLEGVTPCIQSMQLKAGDTITFSRIDPGGKLVVGFRKATNNTSEDAQTSSALPNNAAVAETSFSADGGNVWNKSENNKSMVNADTMQQPTPVKKRTRNIGPKSKRLLMHSDDALELQLTWEEAQDLLRPPPSVKPNIIIIDDYEFEEYDEPPVFGKRTIYADCPSGGQDQWAQCDDCSKWRKLPEDVLLPPKWTCSENVWDSSRCSCSAPEEMSRKDLDNLFRVIRDSKKPRIVDRHKSSPQCEPSGLDALASAAVLGDIMSGLSEPSTTKHPRHRPGCSCIVCIQPPSGKGKHKPTCSCNVCMTVKRRFKTLMLRKKQRQSEREAESSHRDEESAIAGAMNLAVLHVDDSEHDGIQSRKQAEAAETSAGQIDLNCNPDRNDIDFDIAGLGMMTLADPASTPFDSGMEQNAFTNLMCERQGGLESCLRSQTNGEYARRMPDEAFLASMGWNMKNGGD